MPPTIMSAPSPMPGTKIEGGDITNQRQYNN